MGEGFEDAFADGAARGTLERCMSMRASIDDGMRTATVGRELVTSGAKGEGVGKGSSIVKGPGQNRDMSGW